MAHLRADSDKASNLIGKARECIRYSADGKRVYEQLAQEAYKHHRSWVSKEKNPFPVPVYDPKLFSISETSRARILQALFQAGPLFRYLPRNNVDQDTAETISSLAGYHLGEMKQPTCRELVAEFLLGLDLCGTQYAAVYWNVEERETICREMREGMVEVADTDPMTGMPMMTAVPVMQECHVRKTQVEVDSPWFEPLHFTECFPDQSEPYVAAGEFFIIRKLRSKRYLKQKAMSGAWNRGAVKRLLKDPQTAPDNKGWGEVSDLMDWQQSIGIDTAKTVDSVKVGETFEILEMWHRYGRWVTVFGNRSEVLAHRRNPYAHGRIPVLHSKKYLLQREHYGMSIFEVVRHILRPYQVLRAATTAEILLSVFPPLMVGPNTVRDPNKDLQYGFKSIWRVDRLDGLQYMQRPNVGPQQGQALLQDFGRSMDDGLGTQAAFQGGLVDPNQKATAISLAVQGAGLRLQADIDGVEQSFVVPLGDFYRALMQQFQDYEVQVRVTDDPQAPPVRVSPDMLQNVDADLDTMPMASASQTQELEKKRILEFWETGIRNQEPNMDRRGAFEVVVDKILGGKYKAKFLKSEGQLAYDQLQQMAQAMGIPIESILGPLMQQMEAALAQMQGGQQAMPGQPPATALPASTGQTMPDGGNGEMAAELAAMM